MSGYRSALAITLLGVTAALAQAPYQPTTESLRTHKAPQWYEDAKFGVFIHWGPYAVPAYHEWYVEFISPKANLASAVSRQKTFFRGSTREG